MPAPRPTLAALLRVLLKHAAFTVGGGSVTTVALERDLVDEHLWLTRDGFRKYFGLARLTPGTNLLALVTGLGYDFYAWRGALLALAVAAVPGSVLAALLAAFYQKVYQHPMAGSFLLGTAAAVCGLIGASIWRLFAPYCRGSQRWLSVGLFVVFFSAAFLDLAPLPVIVVAGALGYWLPSEDTE